MRSRAKPRTASRNCNRSAEPRSTAAFAVIRCILRRLVSLARVLGRGPPGREEHRAAHPADRHLHERRAILVDGLADEAADLGRLLGAHAEDAVGVGQLHEVRVLEIGAVLAAQGFVGSRATLPYELSLKT